MLLPNLVRLVASLILFITVSCAHITGTTGPTTFNATSDSRYPLTFTTINGPITKQRTFISMLSPCRVYVSFFFCSARIFLLPSAFNKLHPSFHPRH
jgi:hypothetical protein